MERSNKFWTTLFRIFPFADFLHILQLEDYNTSRYFHRLTYFFFRRDLQRLENLTWTLRAKITLVLAVILAIVGVFVVSNLYVFLLLLIFFFAYNQNGFKFLWWILLLATLVLNLGIQAGMYVDVQNTIIPQMNTQATYVVMGAMVLLAGFIAIQGKSSLPKKNKILWQGLLGVFLLVSLFPVDELFWARVKIIILFSAVSILLIPVWVGVSNLLIAPVYYAGKLVVHARARSYLKTKFPDLKIIAVAGSFGKTTTKNFIQQLLQYSHRVQMVPGNINTATGIAQWVLKDLNQSTDILLVEVDGYDAREYLHSGRILQADTVVLTNIGDQHLERFKTRRRLALAMLKLAETAKPGAQIVLSEMTKEDLDCWELYNKRRLSGKDVQEVSLTEKITYQTKAVSVKELSSSNQTNLRLALQVAQNYEIPADFVQDSAKNLELPERRQSEITMHGFQVLDDSYNISYTTAQAGLERASKRAEQLKKQLVVIFAGIPELGKENATANQDYAKLLAKKAQSVVLLETILIPEVIRTLQREEFEDIHQATRMAEAWDLIQQKFAPQDVYVLMQPEQNDLYYAI